MMVIKMNKETINIPSIRFSKFFNVWEICKLKEISERITKKNSELESTLPLTISAQYGLVDQITYFNKRIASKNITNYYLLERGDFAYNKSYSKDYPWGVVKRLDGYDKGVLSTLYIVFKPTRVNSDFLLTYYDTNNWHKEVSMRAAEGARNHGLLNITALDFFDTNLFVPVEKEEQENIGLFFNKLDKTITMQQQLLDDHKQLKKAMLQKMFPQKGESVPRVRFTGFTDCWKDYELSRVAEITSGGTPKTDNPKYWNGSIDWYSPTEIGKKSFVDGSKKKITEEGLNKSSAKILPAHKTILFTSRAGIGDMAILRKEAATNQGFQSFVMKDNFHVYFTYSMREKIKKYALKHSAGSTFLEISGKTLGKIKIKYPLFKEQEKIGNYFKKLDEIIALHEQKLETYQELKKAMLQKMFV